MKRIKHLIFTLLLLVSTHASAELEIVIDSGIEQALPVAVIPFSWSQSTLPPVEYAELIGGDLRRSGRFDVMDINDLPQRPTDFNAINFSDWRKLGMENLVIGNITQTADGNYEIEFRLVDVFRGKQLLGFKIPATKNQLRRTGHKISDIVFEKLTGIKGAFSTRIAYVTVKNLGENKKRFGLKLSDADGFGELELLSSSEPILSPTWSPDGKQLAYVSFEGRNSSIFIQNIITGQREQVAAFRGINSAPSFSPDGSRLAMTLSKDGNTEIYVLHLGTRQLQRITNHPAIDTEASWATDGQSIVFTSDRSGGPQIYSIGLNGGQPQRITFEGKYNSRAKYSPDGKTLTLVHRNEGGYRIATLNTESGYLKVLTDKRLDESPSFAPNGSMIIYSTSAGRGSQLAAVSVDGKIHQKLGLQSGEVREPAWGPFAEK